CTLRFLGRVPDVDTVLGKIGPAVARVPVVEGVQLLGAGAFAQPRRGSVLWVGLADPSAVSPLADAVEGAIVAAGWAAEVRPFRPHVTVARANRAGDLRRVVAALGDAPVGPAWRIDEVVVVSSDTRADGAVYDEVAHLPLRG